MALRTLCRPYCSAKGSRYKSVIGSLQRNRAITAGWALAMSHGHQSVRLEAKFSVGNIVLWQRAYETDRYYCVDAVPVAGEVKRYIGETAEKLDIARDISQFDLDWQQARDIKHCRWFSTGYIALDPMNLQRIIGLRYSLELISIKTVGQVIPLWIQ